MEQITLQQVIPNIFADKQSSESQIWLCEQQLTKGSTYLIEAASGTGKSSFCSYIYGYRDDYHGVIQFDNQNIRNFSAGQWSSLRKNSLSMLFQELRLFTELTARENIELKTALTPGYKNKTWIAQTFDLLGIADKTDSPVGKLSFGQQQRVALIRTLCQPFDFLFLDEPISHLDDNNSHIVAELITSEARQRGAGIIVTSIGKHPSLAYDKTLQL